LSAEDILTQPQPPFDRRVAYGRDPNQFMEVRLPRSAGPRATGPHPILLNIHGGFWRAKYDLAHAGHLCEALRGRDIATFNVEYRRVGNKGGGWPGTFEDIRSAYRFVRKYRKELGLSERIVVMGHSAGGQLALCLAAHERSLENVISLAGVVDVRRASELHLSTDAVAEFLGGKPDAVREHYREADPMQLSIPQARQWLLHGKKDDVVPPEFSRDYAARKTNAKTAPGGKKERVELVEIAEAGHFDVIDPRAEAFQRVVEAVSAALA